MKELTLAYLVKEDSICLGYKKRGFGAGNWNGFGGKLEAGETLEEAVIREIEEESEVLVSVNDLEKVALVDFFFQDKTHLKVHTFFVRNWQGDPQETEEMKPAWFSYTDIPYEDMWEDDQYWLPRALLGEKLIGQVTFDDTDKHITEMEWQRTVSF